ncbi:Fungal Zn2-Cys6 binuclear cluster domain-containing protein [Cladophialophora immunda]|nr:Fungal Zn2-Cys6 binuclear cluster domain-containing protein [Cladophialophora immunda]
MAETTSNESNGNVARWLGTTPVRQRDIACANCARSKTKCDHKQPCSRCHAKGLTCISRVSRKGRAARIDPSTRPEKAAVDQATLSVDEADVLLPRNDRPAELSSTVQPVEQLITVNSVSSVPRDTVNTETFEHDRFPDHSYVLGSSPMEIDGWGASTFIIPTRLNEHQHSMAPQQSTEINNLVLPVTGIAASSPSPCLSERTNGDSSGYDNGDSEAAWTTDWKYWSICRCTPFPQDPASDRQKLVLANLDHNFLQPGPWTSIQEDWRQKNFNQAGLFTNVPLSHSTREWLLVIAQRYMRLAVDIHGLALDSPSPASSDHQDPSRLGGYVRLPPARALHNYLEIVLRNYEPFYPVLPARRLDPNHLSANALGRGPSLLLCFMIAFGSMIDPARKARRFSTAMTEICRHSMHDVLERDAHDLKNPFLYYAALLFIVKGAFSGDKAHMNICIGHRQLYLVSLRHAGILTKRQTRSSNPTQPEENLQYAWKAWVERESLSRLAYGWVLLELEISLLYDLQPRINLSEIDADLPADEVLWNSANADDWRQALCAENPADDWRTILNRRQDHSLRSLFQFLIDEQLTSTYRPQLLHLRLLLYPLHVLVAQLAEIFDQGFDIYPSRPLFSPTTQASSMLHSEEIQQLLKKWSALFRRVSGEGVKFHALSSATMVLYHLISLNLYTSFHEMERFARDGPSPALADISDWWVRAPEHALIHCGQIIRLFNGSPDELRPVWSAAAIYRATLTMWYIIVTNLSRDPGHVTSHTVSDAEPLCLNSVFMEDDVVKNYLRSGQGNPFLLTKNGKHVTLQAPKELLLLGIETIDHGPLTTAFSVGVKQRLEAMLQAWHQQLT